MIVFISIIVTILLYLIFHYIYKKKPHVLLHPNITTSLTIIIILIITKIPFSTYNLGGYHITKLLGVCIVVLAIPMYETLETLMKNFKVIIASSLVSIYTSFLSMFFLLKIFGIKKDILISLIPKSITSAMAIEASKIIGSSESIAILGVIVTGISGAVIGRLILNLIKVKNPIARGCALGMASHVMGTSQAIEEGKITGSFSSLSIPVNGLLTIINLPLFIYLINRFY